MPSVCRVQPIGVPTAMRQTINYSNKNFPNGMFWYFTGAVVGVKRKADGRDYYPRSRTKQKKHGRKQRIFIRLKLPRSEIQRWRHCRLKFISTTSKDKPYGDTTNYVITHWGAGLRGAFENPNYARSQENWLPKGINLQLQGRPCKVPQSARVDSSIRLVIIGDQNTK